MRIVRAAVIQDSPIVFNREATIEKVNSLVSQAARPGAPPVVVSLDGGLHPFKKEE